MSKRYSIAEARASLPSIVDQAEAGIEVELTRRGKPVAVVLSLKELARLRQVRQSFGSAYGDFLKRHSLRDADIPPGYFDELRDKSPPRKIKL